MINKLALGILIVFALQTQLKAQPESTKDHLRSQKTDSKFRMGGYGEILYQRMDYGPNPKATANGSKSENRAVFSLPRLVLNLEYDFTPDLTFSTEIEFEKGGTGSAMEIEYEEFGEYETEIEKGGEIVLEQFHLTKRFSNAFNVRAGHFILALGQVNQRHLPTDFFTSIRPEGETAFMPSTWHETGFEFFGQINDWSYQLQIVNGLDANGFSSGNWIRGGYQTKFEDVKATNLAYIGRIEYRGWQGLNLGASYYTGKSSENVAKPETMNGIDGRVSLLSLHARYKDGPWLARANYLQGNLSDAEEISRINNSLSNNSQNSRTPVAKGALSYGAEVGFNILKFFPQYKTKLYPFVRYEYYNTMEQVEASQIADARYKKEIYTLGVNYFLKSNVAVKLDYAMRKIDGGNFNDENTLGLAVVFSGIFLK